MRQYFKPVSIFCNCSSCNVYRSAIKDLHNLPVTIRLFSILTGDNIFYSGGSSGNIAIDNLCNRIAKAITRGKLVHIPKTGNSSNSGIPMGGRLYVVRADGQQELPPDGQYAEK